MSQKRDEIYQSLIEDYPFCCGCEKDFDIGWDAALKHAPEVLALVEALEFYQAMTNFPLKEVCEAYEKGKSTYEELDTFTSIARNALAQYRESVKEKK